MYYLKTFFKNSSTVICVYMFSFFHYACINVKTEGGGGGNPGICGAFDLYCLPHPQEFD